MNHEVAQGARVVVTAEVRRVQPCREHADRPLPGGNPNGYRPDCPECITTPPTIQQVEVT